MNMKEIKIKINEIQFRWSIPDTRVSCCFEEPTNEHDSPKPLKQNGAITNLLFGKFGLKSKSGIVIIIFNRSLN